MNAKRAKPRDAASLVISRRAGARTEVLLGRREPKSRFMPEVWVFPGGRLETSDARVATEAPLAPGVRRKLAAAGSATHADALAAAAVRETFEETGLRFGSLRNDRLCPDLSGLDYLGRAITPATSPIRYHARFFHARAEAASGKLRGNGELLDLRWIAIEEALGLKIIDVTELMLCELRRRVEQASAKQASAAPDRYIFIRYRGQHRIVRDEGGARAARLS